MSMEQCVLKHRRTTLERAEKFISNTYFTDVNLRGRLYPKTSPVKSVKHWAAPHDKYTPFEVATKQKYKDVNIPEQFGPTWSTHWFQVDVVLPSDWTDEHSEVRLRWNSGSEALVWVNGEPKQGLCSEYDRLDFPLTNLSPQNPSLTVYIEMACNGMFGAGDNGMITAPNMNKQFMLSSCELVLMDRRVYHMIRDVELLYDLAKHLPEGSERGYQALYTVNDVINACDVNDPSTFDRCHEICQKFTQQKNGDSQHTVYAMGHAHIDTAWLWPYSETKRKCARSWSCTIRLMEKYPNFTFTCSQAQQYEWMKEQYPSLYREMTHYIKQGRFIPVGGTWVEMDGLIPSGESFIRQFLYGQRYFQKEFGLTCKEFWLPDTFGYSGQLPQIMRHCGISRFLTQKMSWNLVNKFPHHTFWWEGISGHKVLSHFPPGDSYEMKGHVEEVLRTVNNFRDKGRSNKSAFLFGFGDGGNGPSEDMLERLKRMEDIDGLPKVRMSSPDELFSSIEHEDGEKLCRWVGELYLELHNGTYTTQAKVKKMNRACEFLLHDAEFMNVVAMVTNVGHTYPATELERLWKLLLLNQFHDVLPGSSIGMVYEDAHRYYNDIMKSGRKLAESAVDAVTNGDDKETLETDYFIWNSQSFARSEVISIATPKVKEIKGKNKKQKVDGGVDLPVCKQHDSEGNALYLVDVPSYGYRQLTCDNYLTEKQVVPVTVKMVDNERYKFELQNRHLVACVDSLGRVVEMYSTSNRSRNVVDGRYPANQFTMFDDIPLYWDAWDVMDYHMETRKPVMGVVTEAELCEKGELRCSIKMKLRLSDNSDLEQTIILDAESPYLKFETKVNWHENRKMLKVEFPTSVHTREATYDIQCGHIRRPNHRNTSWDTARFEVCGHKWSDMSEHGCGLAVLNDCKYGHSALDNVLRMTLLRSPKAPDNQADMGVQEFTYALMPHTGNIQDADVNRFAYCLNSPLTVRLQSKRPSTPQHMSYFMMSTAQVVLESVKKAEDADNAVILRLYEAFGGTCEASLTTALPFRSAAVVNGLEEPDDSVEIPKFGEKCLHFPTIKPFQIVTVKLCM